ncbi:hypothetical protein LCGC14_0935650 [marine sediment metagenome]|uniref:Uncharacterized protein n=1 Tax=marine sediment metagenome TaxID=412755 RepID=A0A0F9RT28_9ZZZZ
MAVWIPNTKKLRDWLKKDGFNKLAFAPGFAFDANIFENAKTEVVRQHPEETDPDLRTAYRLLTRPKPKPKVEPGVTRIELPAFLPKWLKVGFGILVLLLLSVIAARSQTVVFKDEGTTRVRRAGGQVGIDFVGAGVSCSTSTAGITTCTITGSGSSTFLLLTDTPASYSGQALLCTRVNAGENAIEFVACGSGGGDDISVNGSAAADADFDDADPAAPANGFNVKWQLNTATTPDSVSAYFDTTTMATSTWGSGSGITLTWNVGATDPVVAYTSGNIKWSGATTYTFEGGATDPVWTPGNNQMDLSTGALLEGGNAVPNSTDKLDFFSATTVAELAGVLSDEDFTPGSEASAEGVIDLSDLQGAVAAGQYAAASIDGDDLLGSSVGGVGLTLTAASPDTLDCDAASTTAVGCPEMAIASEVNTGTSTTLAVTPDALAGSEFGQVEVQMVLFDFTTAVATGDGKFYFHIASGSKLIGMDLIDAVASVITVSSSGLPEVDIARCAAVATGNPCSGTVADVLTVNLTVDANEDSSDTATTDITINTAADDAALDVTFRLDVDTAGTGTQGLIVTLIFQTP